MSHLRLSVGVASTGEPTALRRTLASLFTQERAFDQVVVAHQKGCAPTRAVLKSFKGKVEIVEVPSDLTAIQQWNHLAPHLSGEWISLLTAQDCALPNFARAIVETAESTPDAAILRAGWLRTRENKPAESYTLHSVRAIVKPAEALYEQRFGPKGSFAAAAIRREIWEKVGYFPKETPLLGDWAMWLLAGALGETLRSREIIAEYHPHQQGILADVARKTAEIQETYFLYRDILPRATGSAGLGVPTWIAAASRKRFRDVAIAASSKFATDLRSPLVEALRPWARSVDQESLLTRLEGGERMRDYNLARRVKPAIKRVFYAVR